MTRMLFIRWKVSKQGTVFLQVKMDYFSTKGFKNKSVLTGKTPSCLIGTTFCKNNNLSEALHYLHTLLPVKETFRARISIIPSVLLPAILFPNKNEKLILR